MTHEYYIKNKIKWIKYCHDWKKKNPEKYKFIQRKYKNSKKGKIVQQRYYASNKGKLLNKKMNNLHYPINGLKQRGKLILEKCAICNTDKNIQIHHPNPEIPLHIYFLCKKHHKEQHYG